MQKQRNNSGKQNQKRGRKDQADRPALELFERNTTESIPRLPTPFVPQGPRQSEYVNSMKVNAITFGSGPAGCGKTYCAGALAAELLSSGAIRKLVITRPAVEAGEKLGFLPGEVEDKYAPYLAPFRDVLDERLGKSFVDYLIRVGRIEAAPLAYMRGRTFKDAIVILDEAQNVTVAQMKMFLTRIGMNTKVIVNGDLMQKDISGQSGFADAISRLAFIKGVHHTKFLPADIVRSDIVQAIVEAYEKP